MMHFFKSLTELGGGMGLTLEMLAESLCGKELDRGKLVKKMGVLRNRMGKTNYKARLDAYAASNGFKFVQTKSDRGPLWSFDMGMAYYFLADCRGEGTVDYLKFLRAEAQRREEEQKQIKAEPAVPLAKTTGDLPSENKALVDAVNTLNSKLAKVIASLADVINVLNDMPLSYSQRGAIVDAYTDVCRRIGDELKIPPRHREIVRKRLLAHLKRFAECHYDCDTWKDAPQSKFPGMLLETKKFSLSSKEKEEIRAESKKRTKEEEGRRRKYVGESVVPLEEYDPFINREEG